MSKPSILVVEDHEPLLTAIQAILEAENFEVLTARDGIEALKVMEQARPDLIVADIMMPRMDGYAFYDQVRSHPAWVPIPFIFLTAKAGKEDMIKGKSLGAEDYITKPFELQDLLVAIRARLERAQAIRRVTTSEFDQLKQQIVTILSHELRTPLTYIQGYTSLAMDDIQSLSPEALQEFLRAIKRGADRLTRLVEDLLLLIRLDTGQALEEFKLLAQIRQDAAELIRRTARQYEEQASAQGLRIEVNVPSDLPPLQLCEPLFVDILGRLLDNAIKFTHGKGKQIIISARTTDEQVDIAIQDEGAGIPASELSHLFERFRQIEREKQEQQGVGLGLAIAQELTRLHGGLITVESKYGEGSTFTIHLPIAKANARSKEATP